MTSCASQNRTLEISRVFGTSSQDDSTVTLVGNLLGYVAGAGVVVSTITGTKIENQRFFCANSGKNSSSQTVSSANSYLNMIPGYNQTELSSKKFDSYGFSINVDPEMIHGANSSATNSDTSNGVAVNSLQSRLLDESSSPSKLANKIRTISCIAISPDRKLLAVGESGYQPRVLIYSLAPDSNCKPVYMINEHQFGINKLKFSPDSRKLASLGFVNDGYLNIWSINRNNTRSISLIGVNKCSAVVNQIIWEPCFLMTAGVRHLKLWFVNELDAIDDDSITSTASSTSVKRLEPLKGKNILLNSFINSNFIDTCMVNSQEMLLLSDQGDIGLLDLSADALTLVKVYQVGSNVNKILCDEGNLWYADTDIRSVSLVDILNDVSSNELLEVAKRPVSPVKNRRKPIISLMKYDNHGIIYLSELEEILIFNPQQDTTELLVNSLTKNLSGFKKCVNGDLIVWSKTGLIKRIDEQNVVKVHQVSLPSNELISNELSAVEINDDGEIFAGDKFGSLFIYRNYELIDTIKAHESSVTGLTFFTFQKEKFLVSISRDRMIQVFHKKTEWDLLQTLLLHKGTLTNVLYHEGRIFVCSSDRTISVHKLEVDESVGDLEDELVNDLEKKLKLDQDVDYVEEGRIKIYQEKVLSDKSTAVNMRIFNDELIVSMQDKSLSIYKLTDKSVDRSRSFKLYNEQGDSLLVENFCVSDGLIFVSSNDKSLRCFQYLTGRQLSCNWGHSEMIVGLVLVDKNNLISVGSDGCMFNWRNSQEAQLDSNSITDVEICANDLIMKPPQTQRVARKIIATTQLAPNANRSLRSLSPTTRLMSHRGSLSNGSTVPIHKSATTSPVSLQKSAPSSPRSSPTATRLSTINRLSQPSKTRSPLRENISNKKPDLNQDSMTLAHVIDFLHHLQAKAKSGFYDKKEMKDIGEELQKLLNLTGGMTNDYESKLLQEYSDKLVQMLERKLHENK